MGVDLGTRLLTAGLLTRESLERLLSVLDRSSRSFVDVLLSADEVDEDALVGFFLAEGYGPLVPRAVLLTRDARSPRLSREMCEALGAMPYADDGEAIAIAMVDPSDLHALGEVQRALGRPVRPHVVRVSDLRDAITFAFEPQPPAVAQSPAPRRVGDPLSDVVVEIVRAPSEPPDAPVVVELVQRRIPETPSLPRHLLDTIPDRIPDGLGGLKVATRPIPLVHPTERRSAVPGLLPEDEVAPSGDAPIALTHRKSSAPEPDEAPIELSRPSRSSIPRDDGARSAIPPARPFATTVRMTGEPLGPPMPVPQTTPRSLKSTWIGNPSDSSPPPARASTPAAESAAITEGARPTASQPHAPPPSPPRASHPQGATPSAPPSTPQPSQQPQATTSPPPNAPAHVRSPVSPALSPPAPTPPRTSSPQVPPARALPTGPAPNPAAMMAPPARRQPSAKLPPRAPSSRPPAGGAPSSLPPNRKRLGASGEHWVLPPQGPFPARDQLARPEPAVPRDELRRTDPDILRTGPASDLGSLLAIMRSARDRDAVVAAALDALMTTARRAIFLVVKRDVLQGWDGRGPLISTDALRNLWIPVSSPSVFRDIVEAGAVYRGAPGTTTADAIFLTAVSGKPEEIILQPVVVRGRVVGVLYTEDPAYGRAASERAEVIARACCDAFERIILAGR